MSTIPNYCFFDMKVGGYHSNVDYFVQILQNDYDKIHMYRIFEANPYNSQMYGLYKTVEICGNVAWSIACTMLPGYYSYYDQDLALHMKGEPVKKYNWKTKEYEENIYDMNNFTGTNLLELAKKLKLDIYINSRESGMRFCEDIRIGTAGTAIRNNCGIYEEWWIGEFDSFKDMCDEYNVQPENVPFNENDFNEMKKCKQDYWERSEYEYNSLEIPDKPNYMALNYLYKLRGSKNNDTGEDA